VIVTAIVIVTTSTATTTTVITTVTTTTTITITTKTTALTIFDGEADLSSICRCSDDVCFDYSNSFGIFCSFWNFFPSP